MKRSLSVLCVAVALSSLTSAQTLRWATQGDAQTMDPQSQNELLTNAMNGQVYETLVSRGKTMALEDALATEWQQTSPTQWRFKLRPGVKFHDGTPFTADDVLFSIQRAAAGTSDIAVYANAVGTPKKVDKLTVEFNLASVNPIFLQHISLLPIMSKDWAEKNKATQVQNYRAKEENHASRNVMGTGPYQITGWTPDQRVTMTINKEWWGKHGGNVTEVIYTPIKSDPTRVAALLSGDVDMLTDLPVQDVARLRQDQKLKIVDGHEVRTIFVALDEHSPELKYSDVKGKNPFKDKRVREALSIAIDREAIKRNTMRGLSLPASTWP